MSHPADLLSLPKGPRSKSADNADAPVPPAANQQESINGDNGSSAVNNLTADSAANNTSVTAGASRDQAASSELLTDADGFIDEGSDDELELDLSTEVAATLRSTVVLLIPFILHLEIACVLDALKMLIKRAASMKASAFILPLLRDPALALISTGTNREEWLCTQEGCGKAHGKSLMSAAAHIATAAHMLHLEEAGAATKQSLEKMSLKAIRKEYGV
ncbi:unnamed protein product [Closterium sp. Yama58-4]|nr:unnamed protein product [Closterium sp. Yama58-4]